MTEVSPAEAVFFAALAKADPAERAAYLQEACGADVALRRWVDRLLEAHSQVGSFLQDDAAVPPAAPGGVGPDGRGGVTVELPSAERPGTLIGPYKLLQQIGEGGMGTVFMAEQAEPVKRKVALKIIKPGMDSKQIIARFEAERQALALMDHVNIARVLDAGATEAGRPYFVMELVHGVPITRYCDDNRLTPRARLELFVPVCQAIQHAHQKGIIHRDIKPSNVMVTLYDGKPVPKVIDFGVAKATEEKLTERTLFTHYGTMVGTLEYMSPEQAELSALGVDTRSDIYSLGVLLYELLTGSTPLTRKRMKGVAYAEILRLIKEEEPPKPSTRLSDSGEALVSISAQRHTEPAKLTNLVRGELDWIVMKCLEKDRNRRYESASAFAADVERYLQDEAVQACPPSFWYRFRKLVRRNKPTFVTAAAVVLLLLAGTGISSYFAVQALDRAEEAEHNARLARTNEEAAEQQHQQAQENLDDALAAVDQLLTRVSEERLLDMPQMEHVRQELLEDALRFYQKFLKKKGDDPAIRRETAWAYRRLAAIQRSLGQLVEAEQSYCKAFAMFEELAAQSPFEPSTRAVLLQAHLAFARLLCDVGKREEPEEHLRRAVRMAEDLVKEFPRDPSYGDLLVSANITWITRTQRPPEEAEEMLRRNLQLTKSTYLLANIYTHLGVLGARQGRYPEAKENYRKSLEMFEMVASKSPSSSMAQRDVGSALVYLADAMATDGQREEAEPLYRRALALFDKLANDYPGIHLSRVEQADVYYKYATVLKTLDRTADAEKAYRRAVELYEKLAADFAAFPAYQQIAFEQRLGLGRFLLETGRAYDAQQIEGEALALSGKRTADFPTRLKHWQGLVRSHIELGRLLARSGKTPEAEAAYRQALALSEKLEAEHGGKPDYRREVARCHSDAAWLVRFDGRSAEAEKLYGWALQHYVKLASESPPAEQAREDLALTQFALADHYRWTHGRLADAEKGFRQALEQYEKLSADFPNVPRYRIALADGHERLASVFLFQGRLPEAEQGLKEALALAERLSGEHPADPAVRLTLALGSRHWGETLGRMGRPQEGEKAFRRSEVLLEKLVADFPQDMWYRLEWGVTCQLVVALLARDLKQPQAAEEFYRRAVASFEKLASDFPGDPSHPTRQAGVHREWASCLEAVGRSREAREIYDLASANFSRAVERGSTDIWGVWYPLALLHVNTGRTKEYRALCETLLERFGQTTDPDFWVVAICKLAPDAVADLARPVQLAEKMLAQHPHDASLAGALGDTLYRKGDLDAAVQRLEANIRAAPGVGVHWRKLFLAMAYHRRGRTAEARQLLHEVVPWIEKNGQEKLAEGAELKEPLPWSMRLDLQLLRREAEELLKQK